MTKTILDIVGTIFVVVGIAGFVAPGMAGTHLSPAHNVIHLVTGALALWFGLKGSHSPSPSKEPLTQRVGDYSLSSARTFSWVFGVIYGLLGIAGMLFGHSGTPFMADMPSDPRLLTLIPNVLEFGTNDHILHIVIGIIFVAAAAMARPVTTPTTYSHSPSPPNG